MCRQESTLTKSGKEEGEISSTEVSREKQGEKDKNNGKEEILAGNTGIERDSQIPEKHRTADSQTAVYAPGPGGGAAVFNWGAVPGNCHNGIAVSKRGLPNQSV